jgi:HEAT repeat protein
MTGNNEIESFRLIKACKRLLRPATERIEAFVGDEFSDDLKLESLLALGKIGDPDSLPILTRALAEYDDCVEPLTALGFYKSSSPVSRLIEKLQDPDSLYKEEIVRVLRRDWRSAGDPFAE